MDKFPKYHTFLNGSLASQPHHPHQQLILPSSSSWTYIATIEEVGVFQLQNIMNGLELNKNGKLKEF